MYNVLFIYKINTFGLNLNNFSKLKFYLLFNKTFKNLHLILLSIFSNLKNLIGK
jgi:hypothetical protein